MSMGSSGGAREALEFRHLLHIAPSIPIAPQDDAAHSPAAGSSTAQAGPSRGTPRHRARHAEALLIARQDAPSRADGARSRRVPARTGAGGGGGPEGGDQGR